jgi:hypothetical protein
MVDGLWFVLLLISNLKNVFSFSATRFRSFLEIVSFSRFSETTKMGKKLKKRGRLFFPFLQDPEEGCESSNIHAGSFFKRFCNDLLRGYAIAPTHRPARTSPERARPP